MPVRVYVARMSLMNGTCSSLEKKSSRRPCILMEDTWNDREPGWICSRSHLEGTVHAPDHLYLHTWPRCQSGHEQVTPRVIEDHIRQKPNWSRVHFLQAKQKRHECQPGLIFNRMVGSEVTIPDDVEVCRFWWVQVEQWGHILRRICRGYIPRHHVKPEREEDKE